VFLPSKLADYLLVGRPIFSMTPANGPSADVARACGYPLAEPGDAPKIACVLRMLLERHERRCPLSPPPAEVVRQFSLVTVAAAFTEVLDEAISECSWIRRWL